MVSTLFLQSVVWISVLMIAAAAVLAWFHRPKPGATSFSVMLLAATWWAATSAVGLFTTDSSLRLFWSKVEWAGIAFIPVAWILFAFAYTGRSRWVTPRNIAMLSFVPVLTVVLALTNGIGHGAMYSSPILFDSVGNVSLLERSFGPWFWVHTAYSYFLFAAGATIVFHVAANRRALHVGQVTAMAIVIGAPWIANVVYVSGVLPGAVRWFDPTPFSFAISGWAAVAALQQFRFLDAVPITDWVAYQSVVENLDAGVIVVDTDARISDINPAACAVLDCDSRGSIGDPVTEWLPSEQIPESFLDLDTNYLVTIEDGYHERSFELSVTDLKDDYGTITGHIILLQDVTERRNRVQRLDVLNRVLRHNLRNEMNVIYGYAERLQQGADPFEIADGIKDKTSDLVDLGNKAREMDAISRARDDPANGAVDVNEIAQIECDRLNTAYPELTVDLETTEEAVYCNEIVATALEHVVDNAVQHNGSEDPWVGITVQRDGDAVSIDVADNGPGIGDQERAVIESKTESQLQHSSGLGLWLSNWAVEIAGGSITIEERAATGTRVNLRVPTVEGGGDTGDSDTATA